jgi:hypothetical protein
LQSLPHPSSNIARDILGNRLKLAPVTDDDLRALIDMGLVEMRDDAPIVTPAGLVGLESNGRIVPGDLPCRMKR